MGRGESLRVAGRGNCNLRGWGSVYVLAALVQESQILESSASLYQCRISANPRVTCVHGQVGETLLEITMVFNPYDRFFVCLFVWRQGLNLWLGPASISKASGLSEALRS